MPQYIESKPIGHDLYNHDEVKAAHKNGAKTEFDGWGTGKWVDVQTDAGVSGKVIFYPDMKYRALVEGDKPALLPCPFCGSIDLNFPIPIDTYVVCLGCHTLGPGGVRNAGQTDEEQINEAVRLWNTRL